MTMKEFYKKYNLNKYNFASIAGVGTKSLIKYAEGKPLRESTIKRIEKAMQIAEKYNLVRPKFGEDGNCFDIWYKSRFTRSVLEYEARFKELIKVES